MANARKLPSGNWRVRVFSHRDSTGKAHYESFTASTKAEAEMQAAQFKSSNRHRKTLDLTVSEAIEGYITAKEGVLSPATVRLYRQMQRRRLVHRPAVRAIPPGYGRSAVRAVAFSHLASRSRSRALCRGCATAAA